MCFWHFRVAIKDGVIWTHASFYCSVKLFRVSVVSPYYFTHLSKSLHFGIQHFIYSFKEAFLNFLELFVHIAYVIIDANESLEKITFKISVSQIILLCADHGSPQRPILWSSKQCLSFYSLPFPVLLFIYTNSWGMLFTVFLCLSCFRYALWVPSSLSLLSLLCVFEIFTVSFWC